MTVRTRRVLGGRGGMNNEWRPERKEKRKDGRLKMFFSVVSLFLLLPRAVARKRCDTDTSSAGRN